MIFDVDDNNPTMSQLCTNTGIYPRRELVPTSHQVCGVIYNSSYGGFNYSQKALQLYNQSGQSTEKDSYHTESPTRFDQIMVQIVEQLGKEASGDCSSLRLVYVCQEHLPFIHISEYDGMEDVMIDWGIYALTIIHQVTQSDQSPEKQIDFIKRLYHESPILQRIKTYPKVLTEEPPVNSHF